MCMSSDCACACVAVAVCVCVHVRYVSVYTVHICIYGLIYTRSCI